MNWRPSKFYNTKYPRIEICERLFDSWAIMQDGYCLNNEGVWEFEPMPSSRTPEFIKRTRFPLETAIQLVENLNEKEVR